MTKGEIIRNYKRMSAEDRVTFDRWLKVNAVVGAFFAAGFVAMAVVGSSGTGPRQAIAQSEAGDVSAAARQSVGISPYDLTIRMAPDQLPVQQVDEPF